jgi:UDPglucose--hexose-1-phosphate uridylyltransferase
VNPAYDGVFVFDNDFAALMPGTPEAATAEADELLRAEAENGICRVVCFHPNHSLTLSQMEQADIVKVIEVWKQETVDLGARPEIAYVQIFENRGAMMGSSNPHPHCQIWATGHVPDEPLAESEAQKEYLAKHGTTLLGDYLKRELASGERIVCENESFVALVPFWAVWPFETMILPKMQLGSFAVFTARQSADLADILKRMTTRYDNLFQVSFPYTMGFHQRPTHGDYPEWTFHAHFYPPLLRSAEVKKFMVGFEMMGMPQRDITPESAAERLRGLSETASV